MGDLGGPRFQSVDESAPPSTLIHRDHDWKVNMKTSNLICQTAPAYLLTLPPPPAPRWPDYVDPEAA